MHAATFFAADAIADAAVAADAFAITCAVDAMLPDDPVTASTAEASSASALTAAPDGYSDSQGNLRVLNY